MTEPRSQSSLLGPLSLLNGIASSNGAKGRGIRVRVTGLAVEVDLCSGVVLCINAGAMKYTVHVMSPSLCLEFSDLTWSGVGMYDGSLWTQVIKRLGGF